MSLSSVTLGAGNEFPGVALVTGAAGSGTFLSLALLPAVAHPVSCAGRFVPTLCDGAVR
jgi:hypothetical protein